MIDTRTRTPALRLGICAPAAAAITFGLFFGMRALIAQEDAPAEARNHQAIHFAPQLRDTEPEIKQWKPRRPQLEPPPQVPPIRHSTGPAHENSVGLDPIQMVIGEQTRDAAAVPADSDATPLVRVEPIYPLRAAERGLEGWVEIGFDIAPSGQVRRARVLESTHRLFEASALRAVRRWRYAPRIEDGKPVERQGLEVRLSFSLGRA